MVDYIKVISEKEGLVNLNVDKNWCFVFIIGNDKLDVCFEILLSE